MPTPPTDVTWNSQTLITPAQGVYAFTPSMIKPVWQFDRVIRAIGEFAKYLGAEGCDHRLELTYLNVTEADVETKRATLQNLMVPVFGSPVSGPLVVPGSGTFPHCVIKDVQEGPMTVRAVEVSATTSNPYGANPTTVCYEMQFTIIFRQNRR